MRKIVFFGALLFLCIVIFSHWNPLDLKLKAGLQVTTDDIPSSLFLDGEYLDKSPYINKKILPKDYVLRIEPVEASFAPYELPITLTKGMVTVVMWKPGQTVETSGGIVYELAKLPNRNDVQLQFQTVPDGAILTIDNGAKQFSPLLLTDLAEGSHEFEVSLPSYQTQQHSVNLIKGHKVTVTIILGKIGAGESETTPSAQPATTPTPSQTPLTQTTGPQVQILSTNFFFNNAEVLRVRETPSPTGKELGFAPVGNSYPYLSEATGWFQIQFNSQPGWVSAQFSQKIATDSTQRAQ